MNRMSFVVDDVRPSALRALNYSPQVERLRAAPKGKSVPLRSLLDALGPAYGTVFTRIDCLPEFGVELVSQSDTFSAEPHGRVIRRDSMAHPERHEVKRFQVLVAGAGTLGENELYGRALIADARLEGKYVGPDSMTLAFREPESDQSLFSFAYLASPTGVAAIRSTSYGTKILRFRDDLFGSLPVPIGDRDSTHRVASLVRRCTEQRELYFRELHAARRSIEALPEMREAQAMCTQTDPKQSFGQTVFRPFGRGTSRRWAQLSLIFVVAGAAASQTQSNRKAYSKEAGIRECRVIPHTVSICCLSATFSPFVPSPAHPTTTRLGTRSRRIDAAPG